MKLLLILSTISVFWNVEAQQCPGVCLQSGQTLQNPNEIISDSSGTLTFCFALDQAARAIVDDPTLCSQKAQEALNQGCLCTSPQVPTTSSPSSSTPGTTPTPVSTPTTNPPTPAPVDPNTAACPGICLGESLLNPSTIVNLGGGNFNVCRLLDNEAKQIIGNSSICILRAQTAQKAGCQCTSPPTPFPTAAPVTVTPTVPGATFPPSPVPLPTQTPISTNQPCPGICTREGSTLTNPRQLAIFPGLGNFNFCYALDDASKAIVGNPSLCQQRSQEAQTGGCICSVPSTTAPSPTPTNSQSPSTLAPIGTPTGSPAPTATAEPTRVPTTASPTTSPRGPGPCSGVCYGSEELLNPEALTVVRDSGGTVIAIELCSSLDSQYKAISADPNTCDLNAFRAQRGGCSCGIPVDCSGICSVEGQTILNPNLAVTIDGADGTCGSFDAEWDSIRDPVLCDAVPGKIEQAIAAGCRCGVPIECPGMCPNPGEQVTTPNLLVSLSDGTLGTCAEIDALYSAILDPNECARTPGLIQQAKSAGCKCGVPVACPGICTDANDVITTPSVIVDLPDGSTASCTEINLQLQQLIDPGLCVAGLDEALAAGCRCGPPFNCPGICLNPNNNKVFDKQVEVTLPSTGVTDRCGNIDKNNKNNIIDEEICRDLGMEAIQAGCQCGVTTSSPTMSPTMTPAPTTSMPSQSPTFTTALRPSSTTSPNSPSAPTAPNAAGSSGSSLSMICSVVVSLGAVALVQWMRL